MLYVHVNKCSVMLGGFPVFIGRTSSKQCEGHNRDSAGGEHRTSIPSIQSYAHVAFFSSFTGTVECADLVPK